MITEQVHDPVPTYRFGLGLFIASESFLFAAFLAARFYLAGLDRPAGLNLALGALLTVVLVASSGLGYWALRALRRGDRRASVRGLAGTVGLGCLFLVGVGVEWATAEFSIGEPYGTAFFSITGLHAAHVVSALVVLTLVTRLLRGGRFSANSHWAVTGAVTYWTFVDALWVLAIFPTLYLL